MVLTLRVLIAYANSEGSTSLHKRACWSCTEKRDVDKGSGADPGFLEMGFICIKVLGFALLIISHFS